MMADFLRQLRAAAAIISSAADIYFFRYDFHYAATGYGRHFFRCQRCCRHYAADAERFAAAMIIYYFIDAMPFQLSYTPAAMPITPILAFAFAISPLASRRQATPPPPPHTPPRADRH